MATAKQLKAIRRKHHLGEFKGGQVTSKKSKTGKRSKRYVDWQNSHRDLFGNRGFQLFSEQVKR